MYLLQILRCVKIDLNDEQSSKGAARAVNDGALTEVTLLY